MNQRRATPINAILYLVGCLFIFMSSGGCVGLYFLTDPEKAETVEAEYGNVRDGKVAVVTWADRSIVDEYPLARYQVCKGITHHLKKNLPKANFVSPRDVRDFQTKTELDWETMSPHEISKELECDFVMRVELLEFTPRASDTRQLHKARIEATVSMYECSTPDRVDPVYDTDVRITYPPGRVHGMQDTNEADLLHHAVEYFSEVTARKFYDHEIKLQDKPFR